MDDKVILVAQEISFAKVLASNNKKIRENGVKKLGRWLSSRIRSTCEFSEDDMMRLWKGLFYCMWMADKPLVQEDVAEAISKLIHRMTTHKLAFTFVGCYFQTMGLEWLGIDYLRLDKFQMLVRRMIRQTFVYCRGIQWSTDAVQCLGDVLASTVLSTKTPIGLSMHFTEVYLEELAKVSKGKLSTDEVNTFIKPFVVYLSVVKDGRLKLHVIEHIFHYLIKQSDLGLESQAKFAAWRSAGYPGKSWKEMERVEDLKEEEEETTDNVVEDDGPEDPRAGSVSVELPPLPLDPVAIASLFLEQRSVTFEVKARRTLKNLANMFTKLAEGDYPLSLGHSLKYLKVIRSAAKRKHHTARAAERLITFDKELLLGHEPLVNARHSFDQDYNKRKRNKSLKRKRSKSISKRNKTKKRKTRI